MGDTEGFAEGLAEEHVGGCVQLLCQHLPQVTRVW